MRVDIRRVWDENLRQHNAIAEKMTVKKMFELIENVLLTFVDLHYNTVEECNHIKAKICAPFADDEEHDVVSFHMPLEDFEVSAVI